MKRRTFLQATAVLAAPAIARADAAAIKVGVLAPLTGVVAAGGKEMVDGVKLYVEQSGGKIADRPVQLVVEDDGANPDVALQKARRLVEQEKVDFLIGDLLANTGLAVANYVKGNGMPYFIPIIAADDLTQRARIPNVIRVAGYSASQFSHPFGDWAAKQGYKRAVTISQDYTFGHEQCGGFAQVFTESGGQITQQFWHPLNTADFSPYLGQIAELKPDAVFFMETGADATRLIQQASAFGLKDQTKLIGCMNATDQSVIRTMNGEADGIVAAAHFAEGADIPATQAFVKAYESKYQVIPSLYGFSMYSGIMWVAKALETVGGRTDDRDAFLAAVLKTKLDGSPLGKTVSLDSYGNPIYDVYIRTVKKRADGKYWNVPTQTYPNVSQFWTYDPVTYMQQPPYSRSFQGIKKS
jgi:branched-chain amino acid transport system substrate-binding protein